MKLDMKLDKWQKQVLETKGNICLCSGRQVGKSTIISKKAGEYATTNPNKVIMIIASTERQALLLFEKVLSYIYENDKAMIAKGKKTGQNPTKHKIKLTNGSVIHCLPTGDSGYGIRGYTIDALYADEAHFIPEDVWAAVTPMLATTGGDIILLSTPFGAKGYFHRCFYDKKFTSFHVSTEDVADAREEPQRTRMIEFLKDEKDRMTKLQYQQEYLGLFVGGIMRFFDDDLINSILTLPQNDEVSLSSSSTHSGGDLFLGIDVARMGGDETVLYSVKRINKQSIEEIDLEIPEAQILTDTARLIIHKDKQFKYKKIYIDDGGMGMGVYDIVHEDRQTKNKIVGINNAKRSIDAEKGGNPRKKALLKEDLYNNLKNLMENGKVRLKDNPATKQSLRSIQYENTDGYLKIYGNYSHIVEALIRAAWCTKDKSLNIMAFC